MTPLLKDAWGLVSIHKQIVSIRRYYLAEIRAKPPLSEGSVPEIKTPALMLVINVLRQAGPAG